MNTIKTIILTVVVTTIGYGAYLVLTQEPPAPPDGVTDAWATPPEVDMGGSSAASGMPPLPGAPASPGDQAPLFSPAPAAAPAGDAPMFAPPAAPTSAPPATEAPAFGVPAGGEPVAQAPGFESASTAPLAPPPEWATPSAAPTAAPPAAPAPSDPFTTPPPAGPQLTAADPAAQASIPPSTPAAPMAPTTAYSAPTAAPSAGVASAPPQDAGTAFTAPPPSPEPAMAPVVAPPTTASPQESSLSFASTPPAGAPPAAAPPSAAPAAAPVAAAAGTFAAMMASTQSKLDAGQYVEAHRELSQWYERGDLTETERQQLLELLDALAGTVIYSRDFHAEPPHEVQPGEDLDRIAQQYNIPWQFLQRINGVADPRQLQAGQKLKVVRGPFRATVDLEAGLLTVWLDDRYAGRFPIGRNSNSTPEGDYQVEQKIENPTFYGQDGTVNADDPANPLGDRWIQLGEQVGIHGAADINQVSHPDTAHCIRMSPTDVEDLYDILSVGSRITVKR